MPQISIVIPVYNGEKDLPVMLQSLQEQTYTDYEVVLIDDGSEDGTLQVAERFAQNDKRIRVFHQENQGVSLARNHGMEKACGIYIIFFDADDRVPSHALQKMYDTIQQKQADMVVGIMETVSDGKTEVNKESKKLAEQEIISRKDPAFVGTWSQCNKMYRREFLTSNEIHFIPVQVAEDGQFLYQVLLRNPQICGCNAVVYQYLRKPFWEGLHTASKKVDRVYLADRLQVYEEMLSIVTGMFYNETKEALDSYKDVLVSRFLRRGIMQGFYRRIWRCERDLEERLCNAVRRYLLIVNIRSWLKICQEEWDIPLYEIVSREIEHLQDHFSEHPYLTVVLAGLDPQAASLFMESMINQEFPSFYVIMEEEVFQMAEGDWKELGNIRLVSREEMQTQTARSFGKGRYICWIDTPSIMPVHTLKRMADVMKNDPLIEFVSAYIRPVSFKTGSVIMPEKKENLQASEAVFGPLPKNKNTFQKIDQLDNILANKMFRRMTVRDVPLTGMTASELMEYYQTHSFKRIRNAWVLAEITDKELQKRTAGEIGPCQTKVYAEGNRLIRWMGNKIKKRKNKGKEKNDGTIQGLQGLS